MQFECIKEHIFSGIPDFFSQMLSHPCIMQDMTQPRCVMIVGVCATKWHAFAQRVTGAVPNQNACKCEGSL